MSTNRQDQQREVVLDHGTYAAYQRPCRCRPCKDAARDYARKWRSTAILGPGDPRHGTDMAYTSYACRCQICRDGDRSRRPVSRLLLRHQLLPWFKPGKRHPFVGPEDVECVICDRFHEGTSL